MNKNGKSVLPLILESRISASIKPQHERPSSSFPRLFNLNFASFTVCCLFSTASWAICSNNTPISGESVLCSGTDNAGVDASSVSDVTVNVRPGATVQATNPPVSLWLGSNGTVNNQGTITAPGKEGVFGVLLFGNTGTHTSLINQIGGVITGPTAIQGVTSNDRVENAGTITGSTGTAITFFEGNDTLLLHSTSVINGNVLGSAPGHLTPDSDTLILGGDTNGSFDLSKIGDTAQYRDFENFTKEGASTWTLTGTGNQAWTINAGTLSGNTESFQGNLLNNATVEFNQASAGTFANVISGSGNMIKSGTGTLNLAGINTYSGNTTIANGTLTFSGAGKLNDHTAVTLANTAGANLDLNGTNQSIGSLAGGGTAGGNVNLGAGQLTVGNNNANTRYDGQISGDGSLTKTGTGILNLTGANTYTGGTTVSGGTLSGHTNSLQGNILNNATVEFNQATDGSYAGGISGSGNLTKTGQGSLTLAGNNTYTGTTDVNAGTLRVDGAIAGLVNVASLGLLQGNGNIGSLAVQGTVAPGNSIGTLNVNGNYTQSAGSTYVVEANADGQSDLINVTGSATLQGGNVNVLAAPGAYSPKTTYAILKALGGVTGTFKGVTDNLSFLDSALQYTPNSVNLLLARNDLTFAPAPGSDPSTPPVANTPNQVPVGSYLDGLGPIATGDLKMVLDSLVNGNIAQARTALESLGGEVHATLLGVDLNIHQQFLESAHRQSTRAMLSGNGGNSNGFWLQGIGIGKGRIDGDSSTGTAQYTASGVAIGGDTLLSSNLRLGGAFAYTNTDLNVTSRSSHANSNGYHAALYGSWLIPGAAHHNPNDASATSSSPLSSGLDGSTRIGLMPNDAVLDASLSYARFEADTSRNLRLASLNRSAQASYGANLFSAATEGRYGLKFGSVPLQPYLGLRYQWLSRDSFRENGADSVNLVAGSADQHSLRLGAGVRLGDTFTAGNGWLLRPEVRVGWEHEFLDDHGSLTARLAGASIAVSDFTVQGIRVCRDRALLNAGLMVQVHPQVQLYADYAGYVSSNEQVHGGFGGVKVNW